MNLPNELVVKIFCYMDVGPLIKCSQATVLLNAVSLHRIVWEFKKVKGKQYREGEYILGKQYGGECIKDENLKGICHVHTLDLGGFVNKRCDEYILHDVITLGQIHTLTIDRSKWMDVSLLSHVHTLNIQGVDEKDLDVLGNVHTLDLGWTCLKDVSALGHLHTLYVRSTSVRDVSALGHLHTASIQHTKVMDVTALANVHTVDLYATRLTDVSALANVHSLYLTGTNVKDANALGRLHTLSLSLALYSSWVYNESALANIKKLSLPTGVTLYR